jgi:(p)ppGpp synthase/HD superfamily hydrolase
LNTIENTMTGDQLEQAQVAAAAKFAKDRAVMRQWLLAKDMFKALDAMNLAMESHQGFRKDGIQPEAHHQLRIALFVRNLPKLMNREGCIVTAFTHDLIEDEGFTPEQIYSRYGKEVGFATHAMSKTVNGIERSVDEIFADMARSPIATIVKPADRDDNLANMRGVFVPTKRLSYAEYADERMVPMIKKARYDFPKQDSAYAILRHLLRERIAYEREIATLSGVPR